MKEIFTINSKRWLSLRNYEGEVWKPVVGYENCYEVSNFGRIKSIARFVKCKDGKIQRYNEKILRLWIAKLGYASITLEHYGETRKVGAHRIVAEAFLPNPKGLPQVNHKDENPTNNKLNNLEWCTAKYNLTYGSRLQRLHLSTINNPKTSKIVQQYSFDGELICEYPSLMETRRLFGGHVGEVCNHKCYSTLGYFWLYKGISFEEWQKKHEEIFRGRRRNKPRRIITTKR